MKLFRSSSSLTAFSGFLLAFTLSLFLFSAIIAAAPAEPVPKDQVDDLPDPTLDPEDLPIATEVPENGSGDQLQSIESGPAVLVSEDELNSDDDGEKSKLRARRPPFCVRGWGYNQSRTSLLCCYYQCCYISDYVFNKALYWAQSTRSDNGGVWLWTSRTCSGRGWWVPNSRAVYFGDKPDIYSMSQYILV